MYYSALHLHEQQPPLQFQKTMLKNFQLHKKKSQQLCCNPSTPKNFLSIEFQHQNTIRKCQEVLGAKYIEQIKRHNSSNLDSLGCDTNSQKSPNSELVNRTKLLLQIKSNQPKVPSEMTPSSRNKHLASKKMAYPKPNTSVSVWSKNNLTQQKMNKANSILSFENQSPIHYLKRTQTPQVYRIKENSSFHERKPYKILNPQSNQENINEQNLVLNISIKEKQQNIRKNKQKQAWILQFINQRLKKNQQQSQIKNIYNKLHIRHRNSYLCGKNIKQQGLRQSFKQQSRSFQKSQPYEKIPQPYYKQISVGQIHRSVSREIKRSGNNQYGRPNTTAEKNHPFAQQIQEKLQPW